jgi:hypothetical protein
MSDTRSTPASSIATKPADSASPDRAVTSQQDGAGEAKNRPSGRSVAIGAGVAIGSAAIVAALLYSRAGRGSAKP